MMHADFLDQADETAQAFTDESVKKVQKALEPEKHPDFDGESCLDCGESIIAGRLALGKIRCVYCQAALEKRNRFNAGGHQNATPLYEDLVEKQKLKQMDITVDAEFKVNSAAPQVQKKAKPVAKSRKKAQETPISQAGAVAIIPIEVEQLMPPQAAAMVPAFAPPIATYSNQAEPLVEACASTEEPETQEAAPNHESRVLYRDEYRRRIRPLGSIALVSVLDQKTLAALSTNGWSCTFTHRKSETEVTHYYLNRPAARAGRVNNVIGEGGRIG